MMMNAKLVLLTFLYFIQGLPYGFQAKFLPIYLHSHGTSLTQVGLLKLLLLPWLGKALWAPLVDQYATKQKWLVGSILGLVFSCAMGIILPQNSLISVCLVLFLLNLFAATQDIVVDSVAVWMLSDADLGHGNAAQVVGYKIGSVFGGGILIMFMDFIGWRGLFFILTIVYLEAALFVYLSPTIRNLSFSIPPSSKAQLDESQDCQSEHSFGDDSDSCFEDIDSVSSHEDSSKADVPSENKSDNMDDKSHTSTDTDISDISSNKPSISDMKFIYNVLDVSGTRWLAVFVLIYKLGEQGMVGMLPLFLIDQHMSSVDVSFWSGVIGQAASVIGSLLSGWLISYKGLPGGMLLHQLIIVCLVPQGICLFVVGTWHTYTIPGGDAIKQYMCVTTLISLLFLGGMVTTATFTVMMQCSKKANCNLQATHYTTLATLEVLGKLLFMSVNGWIVDMLGYRVAFLLFVTLSGLVIMWLRHCPDELRGGTYIRVDDHKKYD